MPRFCLLHKDGVAKPVEYCPGRKTRSCSRRRHRHRRHRHRHHRHRCRRQHQPATAPPPPTQLLGSPWPSCKLGQGIKWTGPVGYRDSCLLRRAGEHTPKWSVWIKWKRHSQSTWVERVENYEHHKVADRGRALRCSICKQHLLCNHSINVLDYLLYLCYFSDILETVRRTNFNFI